jgi:EmrB/QacA subfamily drug resistance transporter
VDGLARFDGVGASRGPADERPALVFAVTALGAFMASLDLSIVNVAFPALERSFSHASRPTLAWVITAYSIVFAALLVTAGRSADRLGRRRIFFAGVLVFSAGSALCGLAPSVGLLVAGRVAQGAGAALLLPSSLGLLLEAFPAEKRSQTVALWGGVGALAVATGPSLGAALISAGGWRLAFYVNLPVALIAWALGRRVLPSDRPRTISAHPDYLGVALISATLAGLVLAISEGPDWGWLNWRVVGAAAASVLLGFAFVSRCAHHSEPVLDLQLFRARSFSVSNAAAFVYSMGFFAMLLGNILFLTGVWHYSILRAGLAVTPGPMVVACVAGPAGKLATRIGFRPVIVTGSLLFATGLAWFAAVVGAEPHYLSQWLPGTLIIGLGIGLTFPILSAAAVSSLPATRLAVGSSVNQTARQVGGAVGVAVLVAVLANPATPQAALPHFRHLWLFSCAMAIATGAISLLLPPAWARAGSPRPGDAAPKPAMMPASATSE